MISRSELRASEEEEWPEDIDGSVSRWLAAGMHANRPWKGEARGRGGPWPDEMEPRKA